MDMEQVQNWYGTEKEQELERMWNGNRMCSVMRSLWGFFWSVLYDIKGTPSFSKIVEIMYTIYQGLSKRRLYKEYLGRKVNYVPGVN